MDFHYGAYKIITECLDEYYLKKDDKERRMKQGINLPLELDGEIVGVVGITGSHDDVITARTSDKKDDRNSCLWNAVSVIISSWISV